MDFDLKKFDEYRENNRLEVKKAKGGLPNSLWDTYSSMANCYGGIILLGVIEKEDGSFATTGLKDVKSVLTFLRMIICLGELFDVTAKEIIIVHQVRFELCFGIRRKKHQTGAGLLMFGEEYKILYEYPEYFLDYREMLDLAIHWTDRLQFSSGDWTGNLFDFFFRATWCCYSEKY